MEWKNGKLKGGENGRTYIGTVVKLLVDALGSQIGFPPFFILIIQ
jgi:hypothetical protein